MTVKIAIEKRFLGVEYVSRTKPVAVFRADYDCTTDLSAGMARADIEAVRTYINHFEMLGEYPLESCKALRVLKEAHRKQ